MLTVLPTKRIIGRQLRLKTGEIVTGYFLVTEFEGRIFAKLIRIERPAALKGKKQVICLPEIKAEQKFESAALSYRPTVSTYFDKIEKFFVSQMTRAPSKSH